MIPALRQRYNAAFTPQKYERFLQRMDDVCGTHIKFRMSETPIFIPRPLADKMVEYGNDLIAQLMTKKYLRESEQAVPEQYRTPNEPQRPGYIQVDFGLVKTRSGKLEPKLVELQAFPSLYAYQPVQAREYLDVFNIQAMAAAEGFEIKRFLSDLTPREYRDIFCRTVLGKQKPERTVLLEIDPEEQKTLPDFKLTQKMCDIETVNIRDVVKKGRKLYAHGKPIDRVYNRVIIDEIERKGVKLPFDLRDKLDLEWGGHPNWYFRISKFSIPFLRHKCVPKTWFLDELKKLPADRENYLLKPLYSFAGSGIIFAPTDEQIAAIPKDKRHEYILQEKVAFAPVVETPHGGTQAEIRIMYLWPDEAKKPIPVLMLGRMGRGKMMGVDHNKNLEWVGGAAVFEVR